MVELKISAITDEFSKDLEKVCEYFQQNDIKYVELRKIWDTTAHDASEETLNRAKEVIKEHGLKVSCIAAPYLKCIPPSYNPINPNTDELDENGIPPKKNYNRNWKYNFSRLDHFIEVANYLDAKYIRCFGFNNGMEFKKDILPPVDQWGTFNVYEEYKKVVEDSIKKVNEHKKILICENEGGLVRHMDHIEYLGKNLCGEGYGMLFDTANVANKQGFDGILNEEWLGRIAQYIQYVHAKGCKKFLKLRHATVVNSRGDFIPWNKMIPYFRNMQKSDFITPAPETLFFSIETHMGGNPKRKWNNSCKSIKGLQKVLKKY